VEDGGTATGSFHVTYSIWILLEVSSLCAETAQQKITAAHVHTERLLKLRFGTLTGHP